MGQEDLHSDYPFGRSSSSLRLGAGLPDGPRRFTHEGRESHGLKIRITEYDQFTRRTLRVGRQQ